MILSILKIIGIVILVILALLILILGILLFVPIRYRLSGEYKEKPKADVLIKWAPLLLKVTANYNNKGFEYVVRMFGGVVMTNTDAPLSWIGKKLFGSSKNEDTDESDEKHEEYEEEDDSPIENTVEDATVSEKNVDSNDTLESCSDSNDKTLAVSSDKKMSRPKKKSIFDKIRKKIDDIKIKVKEFIQKIRKLNDKREALLKVYHSKRFEVAKKDLILYIKTLWSVIKPKKLDGYIHFGFEDPATTGQALGVMGMFLVWYDKSLTICPDFEQACFDGYLNGNGKIRLFPIVKLLIKIIRNKNLIKVIKKVQTIIEA